MILKDKKVLKPLGIFSEDAWLFPGDVPVSSWRMLVDFGEPTWEMWRAFLEESGILAEKVWEASNYLSNRNWRMLWRCLESFWKIIVKFTKRSYIMLRRLFKTPGNFTRKLEDFMVTARIVSQDLTKSNRRILWGCLETFWKKFGKSSKAPGRAIRECSEIFWRPSGENS